MSDNKFQAALKPDPAVNMSAAEAEALPELTLDDAMYWSGEGSHLNRWPGKFPESKQSQHEGSSIDLDSDDGEYFSDRMAGAPRKVSDRYRKDAGFRVNRHAQDLGLPTQYSAPSGTLEQIVAWEEAAIADLNRRGAEGQDYGTGFKWTEEDTRRAKDMGKIAGETAVGMSPAGVALDVRDIGTHLAAGATGAALGAAGMAAAGPIADAAKGVGRVVRSAFKDVDPDSIKGIIKRVEEGRGSGSDLEIFEMLKEEGLPEATGAPRAPEISAKFEQVTRGGVPIKELSGDQILAEIPQAKDIASDYRYWHGQIELAEGYGDGAGEDLWNALDDVHRQFKDLGLSEEQISDLIRGAYGY